jgi:DNA-binding transcriptional LysR family regulator
MELKQLQHFLAVVETGSFHAAAERVNLTQQAVSRSIKSLEQELGVLLLERRPRDKRKVGPTPFGSLLLPRARAVVGEVRGFRDQIDNLMGGGPDLVRVAAGPTELRSLLPAVVRRFRRRRPQARLQLMRQVNPVIYEKLATGMFDLVLADEPEEPLDGGFAAEQLFRDQNAFVAPPTHPLARRRRLTLADLAGSEWLGIGPFGRNRYELNQMFSMAQLVPPAHVLEFSAVELAVRHLVEDQYVAYLPHQLVREEVNARLLVALPVSPGRRRAWYHVAARRRDSALRPVVAEFIDCVRFVARRLAAAQP